MKNRKSPRLSSNSLVRLTAFIALTLPLITLGQASKSPAAAQVAPAAKLPPAKEVIANFVKVIGGKEAFSKIKSQHATGKFEMAAQGLTGDLEISAARPDKMFVKVNLPGLGDILEGFDGKVAWTVNPATGPMVLDGKQLEEKREQADFDSVLHDEKDFQSMETIEVTQFEGKECYKLKLIKKSGREVTEYYDTKSGLLSGFVATQESPVGPLTVTAALSEYKKFGDVLFVTKVTQKIGPIEQVMNLSSMEFNKVKDSAFELPEQIKALNKK